MAFNSVIVKTTAKGTHAKALLNGSLGKVLYKRTKVIGNKEAWNLTKSGAKFMRESHLEVTPGGAWHGDVRGGIKARKIKLGQYGIAFSMKALAADRMKKHIVALKPGRRITEWAKDKGIHAKYIWVRPYPYVQIGFRKMLNRLHNITAKRIAKGIVKGG